MKINTKLLAKIIKEQEKRFGEAQAYKTLIELEKRNLA